MTGRQLPLPPDELVTDLTIESINESAGTITLSGLFLPIPTPVFAAGAILYVPKTDAAGRPLLVTDRKVIAHLGAERRPLNLDTDNEGIKKSADDPVDIPDLKKPCKAYKLIGVYEGGGTYAGGNYRPSGACKMRGSQRGGEEGEFCFVCKWLIVHRIDPTMHDVLDRRFYPGPRRCCNCC